MSSPAADIARYLDAEGVGTFAGTSSWAVAVSREPQAPDDVVTVYDTGGGAPALHDANLRMPTIQVRARSFDYEAAFDKHEAIARLLDFNSTSFVTTYHRYVGVWMTSEIQYIGRDDHDRFLITANYQIERHKLPEIA